MKIDCCTSVYWHQTCWNNQWKLSHAASFPRDNDYIYRYYLPPKNGCIVHQLTRKAGYKVESPFFIARLPPRKVLIDILPFLPFRSCFWRTFHVNISQNVSEITFIIHYKGYRKCIASHIIYNFQCLSYDERRGLDIAKFITPFNF